MSDAFISQGMTRIVGKHKKLGERQGIVSPTESLEGNNPVDSLISNFWPFVIIYCGSPRKQIHIIKKENGFEN